jgi:YD repeat-containing protein
MNRLKGACARVLAVCCTAAMLCLPARADTTNYVYDALGRLVRITHHNGSATTYAYDASGNRTQVETTAGGVSAPTANADAAYAYPVSAWPYLVADAFAYIPVLANDSDVNGNPLSIAANSISVPGGAPYNVTQSGDQLAYVYNVASPTDNVDVFTYQASNGHLASANANVSVTRRPNASSPYAINDVVHAYPVNLPPFLVGSAFVYFDPRENDYDFNWQALTITAVQDPTPAGGHAVTNGVSIAYIANPSTASADTFTYTITNASGATKQGSITVYRHP